MNPKILNKTIEILERHQRWRRDRNVPSKVPQTDPIELGAALDYAIEELKKLRISNVAGQSEQLCKHKRVIKSRLRMEDGKSKYCKDCQKWLT